MSQSKPQYSIPYPRLQVRRRLLRFLIRGLLRLLTRTKIEGLEKIPKEGPVILAGNHAAFLEPVLMAVIPKRLVEPIGAGDLPFEGILDKLVSYYGFIPVNRGNLDRTGVNQALDVLKQDGVIGIFPEGGVWAPGRMPPQIGVALLSQRAGAPVVPIGFSGLKGSFQQALQLKHPRLRMRIGEVIPALEASDGGVNKDQLLAYSRHVLNAIYALISEEEKSLIPMEAYYSLSLKVAGKEIPDLPWGSAFARFLHSPLLLDSFKKNLKLPVGGLYEQDGIVDTAAMQTALNAVMDYLKVNPAFFTYRFGMEEGNRVAEGTQELQSLLDKANAAGKVVRLDTHEVIAYKDGRLETSERHFVIGPGNHPG